LRRAVLAIGLRPGVRPRAASIAWDALRGKFVENFHQVFEGAAETVEPPK
jgi:hypothetical protein